MVAPTSFVGFMIWSSSFKLHLDKTRSNEPFFINLNEAESLGSAVERLTGTGKIEQFSLKFGETCLNSQNFFLVVLKEFRINRG